MTLLRLWRDLPSLRDPDLMEAWAYRVLVRACDDELRKRRRQAPALHLLDVDDAEPDASAAVADLSAVEWADWEPEEVRLIADQMADRAS